MGKPVMSDAKAAETTNFGLEVNRELVKKFNAIIKQARLPMYIVLEVFMQQLCDGSFELEETEILKFKNKRKNAHMIHTMINKQIYADFKRLCKNKQYPIKDVISAFMEKFINGKYVLELKNTADKAE